MANDHDANLPSDIYSNRSWVQKFRVSFRGLWLGVTGTQSPKSINSFIVHVPMALVVLMLGVWIGLDSNLDGIASSLHWYCPDCRAV